MALGQAHQPGEAGLVGDVEHRPGPVVVGRHRTTGTGLGLDLGTNRFESMLGVGQEDEPEHRPPVLAWRQRRVGPQLVGRRPQRATNRGEVGAIHVSVSSG